jgi:hypothetical protein
MTYKTKKTTNIIYILYNRIYNLIYMRLLTLVFSNGKGNRAP